MVLPATTDIAARRILIAGASGVIGTAAVEQFAAEGWQVAAVSRRPPDVAPDTAFRHFPLDLMDAAACRAAASEFQDITHVLYAALFEKPGMVAGWTEPDQMRTNLAMMQNLLEPLQAVAGGLRHISLLQGTKAYGAHLHPIKLPGREDRPRDPHENFYWLQEDYIRKIQAGSG